MRTVTSGVGVQGMPAELWNKPGQLEQKGEQPPAILLGEGRSLWALGGGRVSPAPACGHWPAWPQRAGMALAQVVRLSRPRALVWAGARCFQGEHVPNCSFTDKHQT